MGGHASQKPMLESQSEKQKPNARAKGKGKEMQIKQMSEHSPSLVEFGSVICVRMVRISLVFACTIRSCSSNARAYDGMAKGHM
jgi:hypothetical protein